MLTPMAAGNAVHLLLRPPEGAVSWRVKRRPAAAAPAIAGPDDPAAETVVDDWQDRGVTDLLNLVNGVAYRWAVFYRAAGGAWLPQVDERVGTPAATYRGDDLDVQELLRERVELGLAEEVRRQVLKPATGVIEVTLAPFAAPSADELSWPFVSVCLAEDGPGERGIGDMILPDLRTSQTAAPGAAAWTENTGWLAQVAVKVVGVENNPERRLTLRRALRRIVQANMPVLAAKGVILPSFHQVDRELQVEEGMPLYVTDGTFTCMAPSYAEADVLEVRDVEAAWVEPVPDGGDDLEG